MIGQCLRINGITMRKSLENKLAASYAEALYEAETAAGQDQALSDAFTLSSALKNDAKIAKYLSNPLWKTEAKKAALLEAAQTLSLGQGWRRCLELLADNHRLAELAAVAAAYIKVYYRRRNIVETEVISAVPLSADEKQRLQQALEQNLSRQVAVNYTIKPEILGGLIVQCGSQRLDDSLSGKLNQLELLMKGKQ